MTDSPNFNHKSNSQIVVGLVLNGVQPPHQFDADKLVGQYSDVMRDLQAGKNQEDIIAKYGTTLIQPAKYAAQSVNGLGTECNWSEILNKSYVSELAQESLNRVIKYLSNGDEDKARELLNRTVTTLGSNQRLRSKTADEIQGDYTPFIKSGTEAWDKNIGGFPAIGLIIFGAKWGEGKTTSAIGLMDNFLQEYPEKEILFVTLEDMEDGWRERAGIVLGEKSPEFWKRVRVMEFASSADDIIQEASLHPNVGLIVVDYVDYLAKTKSLEGYEEIYKTLAMGSKTLAVNSKFRSMPIMALAQIGRGAWQGGVPTPAALMYTGEQYAYQLVMAYDPNNDFHSDNENNPYTLPTERGFGFFVVWKVKNGCRPHLDEFPGAIKLPLSKRGGFNIDVPGQWFPLTAETKKDTRKKR
jgi:hypothetical protein